MYLAIAQISQNSVPVFYTRLYLYFISKRHILIRSMYGLKTLVWRLATIWRFVDWHAWTGTGVNPGFCPVTSGKQPNPTSRNVLSRTSDVMRGYLSPRHGTSWGCGWRNGLLIWRVAANILEKQLQTADKGRFSNDVEAPDLWSSCMTRAGSRRRLSCVSIITSMRVWLLWWNHKWCLIQVVVERTESDVFLQHRHLKPSVHQDISQPHVLHATLLRRSLNRNVRNTL